MKCRILAGCLLMLVSFTACKKDKALPSSDYNGYATIIDAGNPAADGCGFMLKVDSLYYSPLNLPEAFKVNSLEVKVSYSYSGNGYTCGFSPTLYKTISIISIVKK